MVVSTIHVYTRNYIDTSVYRRTPLLTRLASFAFTRTPALVCLLIKFSFREMANQHLVS